MSLESSKKILKIFGIFDIICGGLVILLALMGFLGVSQEPATDEMAAGMLGMAIILALGLVSVLEGVFSIRGAKDPSKIMPAWIFAIFGVITGVTGLFTATKTLSAVSTLAVNIVTFIAANNIKKSNAAK